MKMKLLGIVALTLLMAACNLQTPTNPSKIVPTTVTSVTVATTTSTLTVNATTQLVATAYNTAGSVISGVTFTFTSSKPSVATVNASGLVTGVASGSVSFTACDGQVCSSSSATITVSAPASGNAPSISRLSPPMALVGSTYSIPITITGTGFTSDTVVNGFGSTLTPTIVGNTLTVEVPQAAWTVAGTLNVSVSNANGESSVLPFLVTSQGFVSIPFDDGYSNTLANGAPVLDKATDAFGRQGIPWTWYIITSKPGSGSYFASWSDIKTEALNPNVEIGNHTRTHNGQTAQAGSDPGCPILFLTLLTNSQTSGTPGPLNCIYDKTPLANTTLEDETQGAQNDLIAQGFNPTTFAYPYGDYDVGWDSNNFAPNYDWPELPFAQQTVEQAINAITVNGSIQMTAARTTDFGANQNGAPPNAGYTEAGWNPYSIPSFEVNQIGSCALTNPTATDPTGPPYVPGCPTTEAMLEYWMQCALPNAYNPNSNGCDMPWTIITFHQVDPTQQDAYNDDLDAVPTSLLQSMVSFMTQKKILVVTMAEGYAILGINGKNCPGTSGDTTNCNADQSAMLRGRMPISHVLRAMKRH